MEQAPSWWRASLAALFSDAPRDAPHLPLPGGGRRREPSSPTPEREIPAPTAARAAVSRRASDTRDACPPYRVPPPSFPLPRIPPSCSLPRIPPCPHQRSLPSCPLERRTREIRGSGQEGGWRGAGGGGPGAGPCRVGCLPSGSGGAAGGGGRGRCGGRGGPYGSCGGGLRGR